MTADRNCATCKGFGAAGDGNMPCRDCGKREVRRRPCRRLRVSDAAQNVRWAHTQHTQRRATTSILARALDELAEALRACPDHTEEVKLTERPGILAKQGPCMVVGYHRADPGDRQLIARGLTRAAAQETAKGAIRAGWQSVSVEIDPRGGP